MSYSKTRLKAMMMKQLPAPEQYEQVIYKYIMLPYPYFATRFIEGNFIKVINFTGIANTL
jgi:hypothetical protein